MTSPINRHCITIARLLLGLIFLIFGLNGFFRFIPPPTTPMPEEAVSFAEAMMKTGYLFPLVAGTQVLVGVLLLANFFVPLALVLITPIVVNIVAFHLFLAPEGTSIAVIVALLEVYLLWSYRQSYRPLLAPKTKPGTN